MNLRLDVTYELTLENQARIRKHAHAQWAAGLNTVDGQEDSFGPADEQGAPTELRASLAQDGGAL